MGPVVLVAALLVSGAPLAWAGDTPPETVTEVIAHLDNAKAQLTDNTTAALAALADGDALFTSVLLAGAGSPNASAVAGEWDVAMEGAETAVRSGDGASFGHYRQVLIKLQYSLAWVEAWWALDVTEQADDAGAWYAVVTDKFGWSAADNDAAAAMETITNDPTELTTRRSVVYDVTVAKFADKVLEEVAEVAMNLPDNRAAALEKAGEGLGYFYGLRSAVARDVGPVQATLAEGAVRASVAAAWRGDKGGAEQARAALEAALAQFLGTDDLRSELGRLDSIAGLVSQEYGAAVEGGVVVDQGEYAEATAFMAELEERWARVAAQARALDGGEATAGEVEALLLQIAVDIDAKVDERDVALDIVDLRVNLTTLQSLVPSETGAGPAPAPADSGPWLLLGTVVGVMVGVIIAAVAFFVYLRRALSRLPPAAPPPKEGPSQ